MEPTSWLLAWHPMKMEDPPQDADESYPMEEATLIEEEEL
jgi:hypothetical protein